METDHPVSWPKAKRRIGAQAAFKRFIEMPIPNSGGELIDAALARVTAPSPDERELAARVLARNAITSDAPAISGVIGSCREQRRVLHDFLRILTAEAHASAAVRRRLTEVARALLRALEDDPLAAGLRLTLCGSIVGADALESELHRLATQSFPLAAILSQAEAAITQLGQTRDFVKLPAIELRFTAASDPHLRLLGFITLTVQARDADRWTDARRERLARHRTDPSPLVAMRAQYFFEDVPERL